MDTPRLQRTIKRMCFEILEANSSYSSLLLFGINERGLALANKLAEVFSDIWDGNIDVVQLDLRNGEGVSTLDFDNLCKPGERMLLVIDDVIFSGKTMFRALTEISKELDPVEIHTVCLVDRGHRKFPVKAGFCGITLPTKSDEHVSVTVKDNEIREVLLEKV